MRQTEQLLHYLNCLDFSSMRASGLGEELPQFGPGAGLSLSPKAEAVVLLFSSAPLGGGDSSASAVGEALRRHRSLQERFRDARARLCWAHAGPSLRD